MRKKTAPPIALLVIDMQLDFVSPTSPVYVAGAGETIPTIRALLDEARKRRWSVFHVIRRHAADGSDAEPFRQHYFATGQGICVEDRPGSQIVAELMPMEGEQVVVKKRFSAFFQTSLGEMLCERGIRTLVLAGTQYPNCVRATAVDALARDFQVLVINDACSAASPAIAKANILDMQNMHILCVPLARLDAAMAIL